MRDATPGWRFRPVRRLRDRPLAPPVRRYDATMRLTAWEEERLLVFAAAELARRHRDARPPPQRPRGGRAHLRRDARGGAGRGAPTRRSRTPGAPRWTRADVLDGVRELVDEVRLEVLMGDGTRLVVLLDPLGRPVSDRPDGPGAIRPATARRPSDRERETASSSRSAASPTRVDPRLVALPVPPGQPAARSSTARPPTGFRLDLPAGATERWAPGETRTVRLVRFGGDEAATVSATSPRTNASPATARRPATASASATRTCGSGSPRTARRPATSRSGATRRPSGPAMAQGAARPVGARRRRRRRARPRSGRRRASRPTSGSRTAGSSGVGRAGNPRDQRRHRAADRTAYAAVHGLRPDRDPGRGRQPRPRDQPGARCRRPCPAA